MIGSIDNLGGEDRFRFSLDNLTTQTGLTRYSVIQGKRFLHRVGILAPIRGGEGEQGQDLTDILAPNWDFRMVMTPTSPSRCWLDFRCDGK